MSRSLNLGPPRPGRLQRGAQNAAPGAFLERSVTHPHFLLSS